MSDTVQESKPMNIYQRLDQIRQSDAVGYIKKDKDVNKRYKAVTHDTVTATLRNELIKHGVLVVPRLTSQHVELTGSTTKQGNVPIIRYEAIFDIEFVNIDDPKDRIGIPMPAHANDEGDKAPGKAISYATKYAMLKLFNIETGEDEESRINAKVETDEETELAIIACKTKDELDKVWRSVPAEKRKGLSAVAKKRLNELKEAANDATKK